MRWAFEHAAVIAAHAPPVLVVVYLHVARFWSRERCARELDRFTRAQADADARRYHTPAGPHR